MATADADANDDLANFGFMGATIAQKVSIHVSPSKLIFPLSYPCRPGSVLTVAFLANHKIHYQLLWSANSVRRCCTRSIESERVEDFWWQHVSALERGSQLHP